MANDDFLKQATLPRPLLIGRTARLLFGAGTLFYFLWLMINFPELVGGGVPDVGWWVGAGVAFWYLPEMINIGFSRSWGRKPQILAIALALILLVANVSSYGSVWAPPLAWGIFLTTAMFFGLIWISFLLAAVLAVPG